MTAVSLADVRTFLNLTSTAQDDEVADMVDRAEAILARRIGPLEPVRVVDEVHTGPGPIFLRVRPVRSVASVTTYGAAPITANLDLDVETGALYGCFSSVHRGTRVTYTAGWPWPLPADLEAAVLELTKHLWESQRVAKPGNRPGFGGGDMSPEVETGARYLLPYRVQTLIDPYLPGPSVA